MTFYLSHLLVRYQSKYQIAFHLILDQSDPGRNTRLPLFPLGSPQEGRFRQCSVSHASITSTESQHFARTWCYHWLTPTSSHRHVTGEWNLDPLLNAGFSLQGSTHSPAIVLKGPDFVLWILAVLRGRKGPREEPELITEERGKPAWKNPRLSCIWEPTGLSLWEGWHSLSSVPLHVG